MSTTPPTQVPAGWYADPYVDGGQRWWDGAAWGPQTKPPAASWPSLVGPDPAGPEAVAARKAANRALAFSIVAVVVNPFFVVSAMALRRLLNARRLARKVPGVVSETKLGWALGLTIASACFTAIGLVGLLVLHLDGGSTSRHAAAPAHHAAAPAHHETAFEKNLHSDIDTELEKAGKKTTVTSVRCPSTDGVRGGDAFDCVATAGDGSTAKVHVDVRNDGSYAWQIVG